MNIELVGHIYEKNPSRSPSKVVTRPPLITRRIIYKAYQYQRVEVAKPSGTMTVTEFASLELLPLEKLDPLLAELFEKLASWQAGWSGYQLLFFTDVNNPAKIYLVTGWKDVEAHKEWIASDQNQELLFKYTINKQYLKIIGMVHIDMDFDEVPRDEKRFVCERFRSWAEVDENKLTEKGAVLDSQVEWVGAGKVLPDPPETVDGVFYRLTVCSDKWRDKILASATEGKEVIEMELIRDMKAILEKALG